MDKLRNKLRSDKGAGEFISYTVSLMLLLILLITVVSVVGTYYAGLVLNGTAEKAARAIVICEDMESAESVVQEFAESVLTGWKFVPGSVTTDVRYESGGVTDWKKGTIVMVSVSAEVTTVPPSLPRRRSYTVSVMIEYDPHNGRD